MSVIGALDSSIVVWLSHFAGKWEIGDYFVKVVSENPLLQAAVPVTILWFFWFHTSTATATEPEPRRTRELVIATLLGSSVALLIARGLAMLLPFRARPFATLAVGYHVIHPDWNKGLYDWSSFPSDHAVLFFALATGILLISRRIGVLMLIYAALADSLPRVYEGIHYPSDIVAGALLGVLIARLALTDRIRRPLGASVLSCVETYPGVAYAVLFLFTFEIATMFDSALQLARTTGLLVMSVARHEQLLLSAITAPGAIRGISALAICMALGVCMALAVGIGLLVRRTKQRPNLISAAGALRAALPAEERPIPLDVGNWKSQSGKQWWRPELLEFTHDAIIIWEMDGAGIVYWNGAAETLYGYSRDEAYGKVTHALLETRIASGGKGSELEATLARFGVWVGELIHTTRTGRKIEVEGRLSLMSQQNGRWLVLEVNRDITDRRKADAARRSTEPKLSSLRRTLPH